MDFRDTWPSAAEVINEIERIRRESELKDRRMEKMEELIFKQREIIRLLKDKNNADLVSKDYEEFIKAAFGGF